MVRRGEYPYEPDYVTLPGSTLEEVIGALGMTQVEFAERTGHSAKTINEIIKGKAPITPEMAIHFERVTGVPASFWNNRERNYRDFLARAAEKERLEMHLEWLSTIPVRAMAKQGWIRLHKDRIEQMREVLGFFGIASPDQWDSLSRGKLAAAFRKSGAFKSDPGAVAAWLRKGELDAQRITCDAYDERKFRLVLRKARALTCEKPESFIPQLTQICAACGVAVTFVPELPKTRVCAGTRWLSPDKAIIQLSLRYKANDQIWFSFFHEAAHVLLHGKSQFFLRSDGDDCGDFEESANRYAAEMLIPGDAYRSFIESGRFRTETGITEFAREIGVAPGIIVGRLQHDRHIGWKQHNGLKEWFEWTRKAA